NPGGSHKPQISPAPARESRIKSRRKGNQRPHKCEVVMTPRARGLTVGALKTSGGGLAIRMYRMESTHVGQQALGDARRSKREGTQATQRFYCIVSIVNRSPQGARKKM